MNQLLLRRPLSRPAPTDPVVAQEAFGYLREAHLQTVYGFVRRRLPTRDDAEDTTAETFSAAYAAMAKCPTDESLHGAWLLGIARKKVADLLRKRYRRKETLMEHLPECLDLAPTPETAALRAEDALQLRRAVLSLTPDQRDALLLKYADGLSLNEIAQILGKSESAISSLLQRARSAVFERAAYHFLPEEPKTP